MVFPPGWDAPLANPMPTVPPLPLLPVRNKGKGRAIAHPLHTIGGTSANPAVDGLHQGNIAYHDKELHFREEQACHKALYDAHIHERARQGQEALERQQQVANQRRHELELQRAQVQFEINERNERAQQEEAAEAHQLLRDAEVQQQVQQDLGRVEELQRMHIQIREDQERRGIAEAQQHLALHQQRMREQAEEEEEAREEIQRQHRQEADLRRQEQDKLTRLFEAQKDDELQQALERQCNELEHNAANEARLAWQAAEHAQAEDEWQQQQEWQAQNAQVNNPYQRQNLPKGCTLYREPDLSSTLHSPTCPIGVRSDYSDSYQTPIRLRSDS